MVLIQITRGTEEFIYEAKTTDSVDSTTRSISSLHNLRLQVKRLVAATRELAKFGPQKEEKERGLSKQQIEALGKEEKEVEGADPLGMRVGEAPPPQLQATLNKVCDDAEAAISNVIAQLTHTPAFHSTPHIAFLSALPHNSPLLSLPCFSLQNHAKLRRPLSLPLILSSIANIRGAVLMAYPMNLPPYDPIRLNLEFKEDLSHHEDSTSILDPETSVLWFAGKAMSRSDPLSIYIGKNEKVSIKAKVEPAGASAPSRPPPVDAETQQKLMAHWHKKEAEAKAMAEEGEDAYLNSEWANPRGFKQQMHGLGQVAFRPGR